MVKSETTIRRELKAVQAALKDDNLTSLARDELTAGKATLQWVLGKPNLEWTGVSARKKESHRIVVWVEDPSGRGVD